MPTIVDFPTEAFSPVWGAGRGQEYVNAINYTVHHICFEATFLSSELDTFALQFGYNFQTLRLASPEPISTFLGPTQDYTSSG